MRPSLAIIYAASSAVVLGAPLFDDSMKLGSRDGGGVANSVEKVDGPVVDDKGKGLRVRDKGHGLVVDDKGNGLRVRDKGNGLSIQDKGNGLRVRDKGNGLSVQDKGNGL